MLSWWVYFPIVHQLPVCGNWWSGLSSPLHWSRHFGGLGLCAASGQLRLHTSLYILLVPFLQISMCSCCFFLVPHSASTVTRCRLVRSACIPLWRPTSHAAATSTVGHACCTTSLWARRVGPSAPFAMRPCTALISRGPCRKHPFIILVWFLN